MPLALPLTDSRVHGLEFRLCRGRLARLNESPSLCDGCPCATRENGRTLPAAGRLPLAQASLSLLSCVSRVPEQPHLAHPRLSHTAELCCCLSLSLPPSLTRTPL